MFKGWPALTSLNLSNFDTSKVKQIYSMFANCINLEYINMINFKENSLQNDKYSDMFSNIPDNVVLCINKDNIPKIYSLIESKICPTEDCTDNWKLSQKILIEGRNQCSNNCSIDNLYEYDNKCYSECPNELYKYSTNYSCIEFCPEDYFAHNDICIEKKYEQDILISEFKNKILNNINEYINSTQVINGTNFVGIFLSSVKMNPEDQTKYGISAIDFGYCIKIIKKHYNIS